MDKAIHAHLNRRLDIQEEASAKLDGVLASLNLRAVLKNPAAVLAQVGMQALDVAESHAMEAVDEGVRFAKEVVEKGKVSFQKSDDPNLNEGEPIK